MARIDLSTQLNVPADPVGTMENLCRLAWSRGVGVTRTAPNQADFRRGDQATLRLVGGMFVGVEDFPVIAVVRCDPAPSGTLVTVRALDDLGFGFKWGMRSKYVRAVTEFRDLLAALAVESAWIS